MFDIEQFRQHMDNLYQADTANKTVELWGNNLEEILKQASVELQVPVNSLSYEVLVRGSAGIFGVLMKKGWCLLVYPSPDYVARKKKRRIIGADGQEIIEDEIIKNGDFGLRLARDGKIYFRVSPPEGEGAEAVQLEEVIKQANSLRAEIAMDQSDLTRIINKADQQWHVVGEFKHSKDADAQISISISEDEMKVTIVLSTPGNGGATPTGEEMKQALINYGVFFGIKEDVLEQLEGHPTFRNPILVAEGENPKNGANLHLKCLFDTGRDMNKAMTKDAPLDLKSGNNIQNVEAGAVIAEVIPPSEGTPGRTVKGNLLPAEDGHDEELPIGTNVILSDDQTRVTAAVDGQVLFINGLLCVESLMVVSGDVKKHIDFLGTVVIRGNVEDGYNINAKGNIHIDGTVGRSRLTSGGDIYVAGGINGDKDSAVTEDEEHQVFVKCGKSIWAKFIQNCYLEVNEFVVVSDGILNSEIIALKKVLCRGRRAAIIGGRIRACEEINAVSLGSVSGTPTRLEVGQNPKLKDEFVEISNIFEAKKAELADLEKSIENWRNASKTKALSAEKQEKFKEMLKLHKERKQELDEMTLMVEEKQKTLEGSVHGAKIAASSRVCVGVTVVINEAEYTVTNEYSRAITFIEQEGLINTASYEEITDDITKKDDPTFGG
ncbi:MAG: FapA family protein [Spirochaetia bacterium]